VADNYLATFCFRVALAQGNNRTLMPSRDSLSTRMCDDQDDCSLK
jgi:hypothetical protein